jgi:hypothetical protein
VASVKHHEKAEREKFLPPSLALAGIFPEAAWRRCANHERSAAMKDQ